MTDPFSSLRALEQELREEAKQAIAEMQGTGPSAFAATRYADAKTEAADKLAACLAALVNDICESRSPDGDGHTSSPVGTSLTAGSSSGDSGREGVENAHARANRPSLGGENPAGSEPADSQPLAALGSPSEAWQPISTAPKDGRNVMIYGIAFHRELWGIGYYWKGVPGDGEGWVTFAFHSAPDDLFRGTFNPTHWMPLPAPPARPADTTHKP